MAIGRTGSFATVEAPKDPLLDTLQNIEQVGFQKRAEKRIIDDKKEAERKASLIKDDFDPKIELTGNQSVNDLSVPFAMQSKKRFSDNVNRINSTRDINERTKLIQENNRITQNFDNYAQVPKIINSKMEEVLKGVQEGKLNPRDAERAANILDGLNSGKAKITLDENSIPRLTTYKVTTTGELELDTQGKPIVLSENQDLASLIKSFDVHTNSNFDKSIIDFADKFKLDETGYERSGNQYTKEKKDERTNRAAVAFAKSQVSQPGERFELAQRLGIDENDIAGLEKAVAQQFKDRISEKDVQTHNYAFDTNARANRGEQENKILIANPTEIKKEGTNEAGVKLQQRTKSFPLGNVIIDSGQGKKQKATNVYVSPGGKMYLKVEETGFEGGSESEKVPNEEGLKTLGQINPETKKNYTIADLTPSELKTVTTSNKAPKVIMLDFGKDQNEIGRYALKMGYDGAEALQQDFIRRSGGDKFITTPDERVQKKEAPKKIQFDSNGNLITN
jgi:hypothetical protein